MEHRESEERQTWENRDAREERILGCRSEDPAQQRAWDDFAASGKIQDYLTYRGMNTVDRFTNA